jgi:hypothetical protein
VAYRQLCSVTFAVLGLVAFGCGGNTNSTAATGSTPSDNPPANADAPPTGADQAPGSTETPPANPDSPPATADTPAGNNGLGALCQQVCSSINQAVNRCSQGMDELGMDDLCDGANACKVPPAVLPCANQIAGLFQCFIDNVALLCAATGNDNNQDPGPGQDPAPTPTASAKLCDDSLNNAEACFKANHIDTSDDNMNMNMDPNGPDCTRGNACVQCTCNAGTDTTKLGMCATGACAPPPTP